MGKFEYKHYLLILLTVVAVFNLLDRMVLSLVLEPIKQDFQLSDGQLGFLSGLSFALFYAVAGVPIARWADRGNRNVIVSLTTGLWSVMLVFCGLVGSYTQLLLVRVGVAIGEAGCIPTAQSLIADYYNRAERPRAMAIYWSAPAIATVIAYLGGGWLVETVGWRNTFIVMGVPGVLLALLVKFTVREPRQESKKCEVEQPPSFKVVLTTLRKQRTFISIAMAFSVSSFFTAGISQWAPTFFMRSYEMGVGEVGAWLALTWGGGGLLGTYLGGFLATRYAAHKEVMQMRACTLVYGLVGLLYVMIFLSSDQYRSIAYMATAVTILSMCNGVIYSAIQSLVSEHMRSVALAFILLMSNLVGLGLGPLGTGLLSDLLAPSFEQESLRYALAAFSPGLLLTGYCYWKAAGTIAADIQFVESQVESIRPGGVGPEIESQKKSATLVSTQ